MPYLDKPLEIHIELEETKQVLSKKDLISGIKSLKQPVKKEPEESFVLSNIAPSKEEKKKKKKKKKRGVGDEIQFMRGDNVGTLNEVVEVDETDTDSDYSLDANLLDADSILGYGQDYDLEKDIVGKTISKHGKRKKDKNNYKKEFNDELTLYANMLNEVSAFGKDVEKQWRTMTGSRARGSSKNANELGTLVLSAKTQKINIVKDLVALKKTIAELTLKDEARKGKAEEANGSLESSATKYFTDIVKYGRGKFVDMITPTEMHDEPLDDIVSEIERSKMSYNDYELDRFNELIEERISAENSMRTSSGSKYIEYENRDVTIKVKKCIDDGSWEFVAIDRDGIQIDDFPLPSKNNVGKMTFSDDDTYAKDSLGRSYSLITYYLPSDGDYDD